MIIDFVYMKHRKMWQEDRWQFSCKYSKLKMYRATLTNEQKRELACMNKIVEENNNNWMD